MSANLITLITNRLPEFSKGQRRIADFVLDRCEQAAFMTASRLGEAAGVSESTVVRFAAELGYDGYPELQRAMMKTVRSELTTIQRVEVTRARMDGDRVLDEVMACDIANVRQTLDELPRDAFEDAVQAVTGAGRLYIFGAGSCRALASFLAFYLKLLLPNIHLLSTSSEAEILEEMIRIGPGDAIIGLSFPRYSSKTATVLDFAASKKARVVVITDSANAPIARYADHLLPAHSDMATIVDSLVAPLSVVNALIVAVSLRRIESNREVLEELEELWGRYEVYKNLE
ncbi:MAG: MurR/RpiR family transcriptional regulator [Oscillospiraceae bacterium]|nr:MurR/RpiR family transcriptional regulator [Oscillospiraceae bacterium]